MAYKTKRLDPYTVEYRSHAISRNDRNRGYWNHYTTRATGGFSGATLAEVKYLIDRSLGDEPQRPTQLTVGASAAPVLHRNFNAE